jgi:hypothetical protein
MTRTLLQIVCASLLLCQPARAETFLKKILRITGVSATPSQQKAPGEEMEAGGEIWLANVKTGFLRKLSATAGFRSPVFAHNDRGVLAIKDGALWRIPLSGDPPQKLRDAAGITKLVGSDRDDPDKILVIIERAQASTVALLSTATGKTTEIPYDAKSSEDRKLLSHLKGWERVYGDVQIYQKTQTRDGLAGPEEWNDVFLKKGDAPPVNISRAEGTNCGQPSLSPDGAEVVFIRAKE